MCFYNRYKTIAKEANARLLRVLKDREKKKPIKNKFLGLSFLKTKNIEIITNSIPKCSVIVGWEAS